MVRDHPAVGARDPLHRVDHVAASGERGIAVLPSRLLPGDLTGIVGAFLGLLMAIVGLVVMIASVNVAGMMLVRASTVPLTNWLVVPKEDLAVAHQAQLLVQKAKLALYRKDYPDAMNILLAAEDMASSDEARALLASIKAKLG